MYDSFYQYDFHQILKDQPELSDLFVEFCPRIIRIAGLNEATETGTFWTVKNGGRP